MTVKSLWADHQYSQEYVSFLQGRYTEEEFRDVAKGFATANCEMPSARDVVEAAEVLRDILGTELGSADVAVLLGIDVWRVERALVDDGYRLHD